MGMEFFFFFNSVTSFHGLKLYTRNRYLELKLTVGSQNFDS